VESLSLASRALSASSLAAPAIATSMRESELVGLRPDAGRPGVLERASSNEGGRLAKQINGFPQRGRQSGTRASIRASWTLSADSRCVSICALAVLVTVPQNARRYPRRRRSRHSPKVMR
jgi:hypothetical protein